MTKKVGDFMNTKQTTALLTAIQVIAEIDKDNIGKHIERIIERMEGGKKDAASVGSTDGKRD